MCNKRCIAPPSPELEEKIIRSKQRLKQGLVLPEETDNEVLGRKTAAQIFMRPPKTRAHTLVSSIQHVNAVIGTQKTLVLLVDFPDKAAIQTQDHFNNMLFSSGTYATGSMRDYFKEVSYGKLEVTGEVSGNAGVTVGWYRAPQPKSFYTNDDFGFGSYPNNAQKLVEDVIELAAAHVDFSDYDNNNSGSVDALIIIPAGSGGESTGNKSDFWSHKWAITPKAINGVQVSRYFMAPEDGRVGVMSHELGHLLMSWPDLYDTDYSSRGTGRWGLMAGGSWNNSGHTPAHPTAWCKIKAGWLTPKIMFNLTQNITIKPYFQTSEVYKLPVGNIDSKEYFLLSNRQQQGFDAYLPGEGCIIEHIDDNQSNNTDESRYLVDIEQADGNRDLNNNTNSGDSSDVFPFNGNDVFNESSSPNSKSYDGSDSNVSISNITRTGENITATLSLGEGEVVVVKHWIQNKKVMSTYTSYHSQNAWANIQDLGWRKIKMDNPDSVTNQFIALCEAQANNNKVTVYVDDSTLFRYERKQPLD